MPKVLTALKLLRTPDRFLDTLLFRAHASQLATSLIFRLCDARDGQFGRRWGAALPSASLRFIVCGSVNPHRFLRSGRESVRDLQAALAHEGQSLAGFSSILDFGCGSGRMLMFLRSLTEARLAGCDVDAQAIAFCREHFSWGEFEVNPSLPPAGGTSYSAGQFDFIFARSVFTHIDQAAQLAWLTEFRRILKPGGTLLISVHGPDFWRRLPEHLQNPLRAGGSLFLEPAPGQPDGAFHTPEYIEANWSQGFIVRKYLPLGAGQQDMVVLRASPAIT